MERRGHEIGFLLRLVQLGDEILKSPRGGGFRLQRFDEEPLFLKKKVKFVF